MLMGGQFRKSFFYLLFKMNTFAQNFAHFVGQRINFITKEKKKLQIDKQMKRKIEKPEVKVMKLQAMNVIATSEGNTPTKAKSYINGLNHGSDVTMGSWSKLQ